MLRLRGIGVGLRQLPATLAVAAVGGAIFDAVGFPAGWLVGGVVTVAALTLAGVRMGVPGWLVQINALAFGLSVGSGISPETVELLRALWPSILCLTLSLILSVFASSAWLTRRHGWPAVEARFASIPGALPSVLMLAQEQGARLETVAVAQIVRQAVLVLSLPLLLSGLPAPAALALREMAQPALWEIPAQLAVGAALGWAMRARRVPGGLMLGAMLGAAALHLLGVVTARPPIWLMVVIYIVTGAMIGARFGGVSLGGLLRLLRPSLESVAIAMAIAASVALLAGLVLPMGFAELWLAYAPGGVETMIAISVALSLDSLAVGMHHFLRLFILNALAPLWLPRPALRTEGP